MTKSIYLLGFMGCGKSHWGRWAAAQLGCPFVDLDETIAQAEQKTIAAIFESAGEAGFRAIERRHLLETALLPPSIIATGGGTPCFFDNMDWMNAHGRTVFMDVPVSVLATRLRSEQATRPLLRGLEAHQLETFIAERLAMRRAFYEKARITLPYLADLPEYERRILDTFRELCYLA